MFGPQSVELFRGRIRRCGFDGEGVSWGSDAEVSKDTCKSACTLAASGCGLRCELSLLFLLSAVILSPSETIRQVKHCLLEVSLIVVLITARENK